MATKIDTLLVRIEADTKDLRREMDRASQSVDRSSKKMKRSFEGLNRALKRTAIAAGIAFAVAGVASIKLASNAEEMRSKFDVVFGRFAKDTAAWAETFAKAVNRSRFEMIKYLSTFQDTFVPMGFARKEAAELSKQMTRLAVDVASFNDVAEPETIQLFASALVGNHEAVRRYGIMITEARLKQELLRMGMKGNIQEVSILTKVQARLNLIMSDTSDAQGDAERTADSFANTIRGLEAAVITLGVKIGNLLKPGVGELAANLTVLLNIVSDLIPSVDELSAGWGALMSVFDDAGEKPTNVLKFMVKETEEWIGLLKEIEKFDPTGIVNARIERAMVELMALRAELAGRPDEPTEKLGKKDDDKGAAAAAKITKYEELEHAMRRSNMQLRDLIEAQKLGDEQARKIAASIDVENQVEKERQRLLKAGEEFDATRENRIRSLAATHGTLEHQLETLKDTQEEARDVIEETMTPLQQYEERLANLTALLDQGAISQDVFNKAVANAQETLMESNEIIQAGERIFDRFGDGIVEAMQRGETAFESLRNVALAALMDIQREMLKMAIFEPLKKAFFGALFGGVTEIDTSGGLPWSQGRAAGGPVQAGQPYIVGEEGPELIIPKTAGMVLPANRPYGGSVPPSGTGKRGGDTYYIDARGADREGLAQLEAAFRALDGSIEHRSVAAVLDERMRGGSFAEIFKA